MKQQTIGELSIDTILERESMIVKIADFLPASSTAAIAAERDWLEPRYARLDQGLAMLTFHSYLVRTPRHTIVVDTCIGNDKERGSIAEFHRLKTGWLDNLRAAGVALEQVNYVMCTHMHSDHVGWNTRLQDGRWVPTFPNARYLFARREFEHRERLHATDPAGGFGMFADSVLPVVASGQAVLVDSDYALDDHVQLAPAEGHTPGNVVIQLRSSGKLAVLSGDVMHHPLQVMYPEWSSQFCEDPGLSARFRRQFVESHADTDTLILPAHFPLPTAGRIRRSGARWRFEFVSQ
jgi:glyoxylase-like metal-dependent hydrolase (beta-lactamase superfamily II)